MQHNSRPGNRVLYEDLNRSGRISFVNWRRVSFGLTLAAVLIFGGIHLVGQHGLADLAWVAGALSVLVGINTVTYEWPITGTVAPTSDQSRTHQAVSAIITGDGATGTFTVVHNWGLSTAEIAAGFPWVNIEFLTAAGYSSAPIVSSKAGGQQVVFTNNTFSGAGLRVTLARPWSGVR